MRGFAAQEQGSLVKDDDNDGLTRAEFRALVQKELDDYPYLNSSVWADKIEIAYLKNSTDAFEIRTQAILMKSEWHFILPILLEATLYKEARPLTRSFVYEFGHRPSFAKTPVWQVRNN